MNIPFFQIDAFTSEVFGGNPAAVCVFDRWPEDAVMQGIAAENNLSETAYLVFRKAGLYELRWFTPYNEIELCGHATLAAAYAVFTFMEKNLASVGFQTASGTLSVKKI